MTPIAVKPPTDAEILAGARDALEHRRTVPGGVDVQVERGIVTLTGRVFRTFERAEAEDAVSHVDGVQRVVNDLVIEPPARGFEAPDDIC